jgi:hypothetical protein
MPTKLLATAILGLTLAAPIAHADTTMVGGKLFNQYCATCHGTDATGGGPLTQVMTQSVPDLTKLSERNDGAFPMLEVIHIIDGRTGLRGHGGPMPTYGDVFSADAQTDTIGDFSPILAARGRILSIALYLESLQN